MTQRAGAISTGDLAERVGVPRVKHEAPMYFI